MKKTLTLLVAMAMLISVIMPTAVKAIPGDDLRIIPVIVNGLKVRFPDTEPYINTDGRTMVPVRFVSEKLGAEVLWEHDTQTAIVNYEEKSIRLPLDSKHISVNGNEEELDTAAEKHEGRTMVPLRFVSEVLGSQVKWDDDAHSVQIIDEAYQKKIDAGEVKLDPWGREYVDEFYNGWMNLKDLELYGFYEQFSWASPESEEFITGIKGWTFKTFADQWGEHIKDYYAAQLNVDYRTIDKSSFTQQLMKNMSGRSDYEMYQNEQIISEYVDWVKENKIIAKGYADPELSQVSKTDSIISVPVYFKFKIISAEDTSQVFLDNWKVSPASDSFELEKEVWYGGYAYLGLNTNAGNYKQEHYAVDRFENMFTKLTYKYEILQ